MLTTAPGRVWGDALARRFQTRSHHSENPTVIDLEKLASQMHLKMVEPGVFLPEAYVHEQHWLETMPSIEEEPVVLQGMVTSSPNAVATALAALIEVRCRDG
jgi:hypothetical protein